jgi:hypothetical protein
LKDPFAEAKEIFFSTYAFQKWLEKQAPELLDYFLKSMPKKLQNLGENN